ncbi:hypothetical protein AB1282_14605 [Gottfriedia sp. S16(2024)]
MGKISGEEYNRILRLFRLNSKEVWTVTTFVHTSFLCLFSTLR